MTRANGRRLAAAAGAAGIAIVAILAPGPHDARAEVVVALSGPGRVGAVIEMRDYSFDPPLIWSQVRTNGDPALILNSEGDLYRDGPPSIRLHPQSGMPEAVWSFRTGSGPEVAWSIFDGATWTATQLLTFGGRSTGPRMFIDAGGNRRVAFWRRNTAPDPDGVYVMTLPHGEAQWWAPQRISPTTAAARHPDIRTFPRFGTFIVSEEETATGRSIAVYHLPNADGTNPPQRESDPWGRQRVHQSGSEVSLDPRLVSMPSTGGRIPQIEWIEGTPGSLVLGTIWYDTESRTWSTPTFTDYP